MKIQAWFNVFIHYIFRFLKGIDNTLPISDIIFVKGIAYSYDINDLKKGINNPIGIVTNNTRMNRAKFYSISSGVKSPSSNQVTYLDADNSFFGNSLYYFKNNSKWWVLRTHCWIDKISNGTIHIREYNVGATDSRIVCRDKWQHCVLDT